MDRRAFVKRSCLGGAALFLDHFRTSPAYTEDLIPPAPPIHVNEPHLTDISLLRMPGLYPGRVVEIADERSIVGNRVSQPIIRQMLEQGMRELTGEKSVRAAWERFIEPKDIVGIKINPSGAPACCSSPEIVREIVAAVLSVGVLARNILVYDRYAYEMDIGSYQALVPPGIRGVGNALIHGEHCLHWIDENYQCAHDERPFGGWSNRLPEKLRVWHIQQRRAVASYALFFHRHSDRCDVFRGTVAFEGGAACYGWDAHGLARRSSNTKPGFHLSSWAD